MKIEFQIQGQALALEWERQGNDFLLRLPEREIVGRIERWVPPFFTLRHSGQLISGAFYRGADFVDVHLPKGNFRVRFARSVRGAKHAHPVGGLTSPMPGKVVKVFVNEGAAVKKGDLILILEAMKMEHKILAPEDGLVKKLFFKEGERVGQEVELVEIKASPEAES